jgi:hypothetical protein
MPTQAYRKRLEIKPAVTPLESRYLLSSVQIGDYDGDHKADFAIFDPTIATFYVVESSGKRAGMPLGNSADPLIPLVGDYFGDGKTDFTVFDPTNATFYVVGDAGQRMAVPLGNPADPLIPLVGDYDGDGKADFAIFDPTNATFYVAESSGKRQAVPLGNPADPLIPLVGDYFGDGKTDFAVFDPTNASFYVVGDTGQRMAFALGNSADPLIPLVGDYFGDGKTDFAVFDPTNVAFYVAGGAGQRKALLLGNSADSLIPLVADYDGDGKADFAVFDPTNATFYVAGSTGARQAVPLGNSADSLIPLVGDYNGDGKADFAVFDPTNATFYVVESGGARAGQPLGNSAAPLIPLQPQPQPTPTPGKPAPTSPEFSGGPILSSQFPDFNSDRRTDATLYDPTTSLFYVSLSGNPAPFPPQVGVYGIGNPSHHPIPLLGDFNGDGKTDAAVYDPTTSTFFYVITGNTIGVPAAVGLWQMGNPSDHPVPLLGDFNGDGVTDLAIYDPLTSTFSIAVTQVNSAIPLYTATFPLGNPSDHPIPLLGDFNGDGRTDVAIYDPTTSTFRFVVTQPFTSSPLYGASYAFGNPNTHPIPLVGDFNADGKTDFAIYDPTTSTFSFVLTGGTNGFPLSGGFYQFGNPSDHALPLVGDFNADGKSDFSIYDPTTSTFRFDATGSVTGFPLYSGSAQLGNPNDHPIPLLGDFVGDGKSDFSIYDATAATFRYVEPGPVAGEALNSGLNLLGNPYNHPVPLLRSSRQRVLY